MKLNLECIKCNIDQVLKITKILELDEERKEKMMRDVLKYLQTTDYNRTNPEVIQGTWEILTTAISDKNPYKNIKKYYNKLVNEMTEEIKEIIDNSGNKIHTSLKLAIAGNLIDFASSHQFNEIMLRENLLKVDKENLGKDNSKELIQSLLKAKTLLYLGDNCGEIVLDKIFISYLKEVNPDLRVYFGVRGRPIINDVTIEDAEMIKMEEVAEVISNGNGALGTILDKANDKFLEIFNQADVIIAKGQGNFESLSVVKEKNIYYLFMAKCDVVAREIEVKKGEIVCAKIN